jgi:carboxyl-terminal processing protease
MMLRRLPLFLLLAFLASVLSPRNVSAQTPPAQPDSATRVATVKATFDLLMDQFYRVPDPSELAGEAWNGALRALLASGYRGPRPERPDFPADRMRTWQTFATAYAELAALAPPSLSQVDLAFAAGDAMTDSLAEGHTRFLRPAEYRAFVEGSSGDASGIGLGVFLTPRTPWVITEVLPDSPAERAGLRPGDAIVQVDGRDTAVLARTALDRALDRDAGATLALVIERPDAARMPVSVTIGRYGVPDSQSRVLPDGVGYIRIRSFSTFLSDPGGRTNVLEALDAALDRFEASGVTAWVLDLRDTAGGIGFTADAVVGRFLPEAVTSKASTARGQSGEHASAGRAFRVQRPMAVLVNGGSASSSEIVASALQEYGRAAVVGSRTGGVLAGPLLFPLPDGAGLNVAVEEIRTGRRGAVIDGAGLMPDVVVSDDRVAADYAAGRDPQLEAAVTAARARSAGEMPAPSPPGQLAPAALRTLTAPYIPAAEEVPGTPLLTTSRLLGDLALTVPSEFVAQLGPVRDSLSLAHEVRGRRWQGSYSRFYGQQPGPSGPHLSVTIDVYTAPAGAYAALNGNDAPLVQRSVVAPVQLGDGSVAYTGIWQSAGKSVLLWRSGRLVITVTYSGIPGQESFEPVVALARMIDARIQARPLVEPEPVQ